MTIEDEILACPVCGSKCDAKPLRTYTAQEAANHFCPPIRDLGRNRRFHQCISRIWNGEISQIYRCGECSFAFGHPFAGGDEEFYAIMHEMAGYPSWRWEYGVLLSGLAEDRRTGSLMDIGAGDGKFLQSLGPDWRRFAIESTPLMQEKLREAGVTVFRYPQEAVENARGTMDVVTMFQVLEHLSNFREALRTGYELLRPEGIIAISVPCGDRVMEMEMLTHSPDMPPNHINKWSPRALALALTEAGFQVESPIFEPASIRRMLLRVHMRVRSTAARRGTLAAQVYRLGNKKLRMPLLAMLTLASLVRLAPSLRKLSMGSSMLMIGRAIPDAGGSKHAAVKETESGEDIDQRGT